MLTKKLVVVLLGVGVVVASYFGSIRATHPSYEAGDLLRVRSGWSMEAVQVTSFELSSLGGSFLLECDGEPFESGELEIPLFDSETKFTSQIECKNLKVVAVPEEWDVLVRPAAAVQVTISSISWYLSLGGIWFGVIALLVFLSGIFLGKDNL